MTGAAVAGQQWVKELRKYVGHDHRVCGTVAGFTFPAKDGTGDCTLRLNFGDAERPKFYVVVPSGASGDLSPADAIQYVTDDLCVTATLEEDSKRVLNMSVSTQKQIEVTTRRGSPFGAGTHLACEKGMVAAKAVREVKPNYTPSLMKERAQDVVLCEIVIADDGTVADARVLCGKYPEMNEQAMTALWQWRFKPATLNGAPVSIVALVELAFTLR